MYLELKGESYYSLDSDRMFFFIFTFYFFLFFLPFLGINMFQFYTLSVVSGRKLDKVGTSVQSKKKNISCSFLNNFG